MQLIRDWTGRSWELLQIRGWWFAVGLVLCIVAVFLPLKAEKSQNKHMLFLCVVLGIFLPVCNFAAIPLAVLLKKRDVRIGAVIAFLCAANLLNPAGMLLGWAYMGAELASSWMISAVLVSLFAGIICGRLLQPKENEEAVILQTPLKDFRQLVPELACWLVAGVLAQGFLQVLIPNALWSNLLLNPKDASFVQVAVAGLCRHVCLPDDVSLAASMVATGLRPGYAVLFLVAGVCTNLPELFVLYGMTGKKTAVGYLCITTAAGLLAAFATECLIGSDFVPQFNLADTEHLVRLANLCNIRTWMPARIPCACILLFLAGLGLWRRNDHLSFGPIQHGRTENKRKN